MTLPPTGPDPAPITHPDRPVVYLPAEAFGPLQLVPPERDDRLLAVDPDLLRADVSDRALRLALVASYLDRPELDTPAADLAGLLRCSIPQVRDALDELGAVAAVVYGRHADLEIDW